MVSLFDIRRLVAERPGITKRDLAWHFHISENLMDGLLTHLIDRGDLATVRLMPNCAGCSSGCASASTGCQVGYRRTYTSKASAKVARQAS